MPTDRIGRITVPTRMVLRDLLSSATPRCGADIADSADIGRPTVYTILNRLAASGLLERTAEDGDPRQLGRPRKYFYRISDSGLDEATAVVRGAST